MLLCMRPRHLGLVALALTLGAGVGLRAIQTPASTQPAPLTPAQSTALFENTIRPLLAANCYACHGESAMAGLRVDSREGLLRGGAGGPVIVPGNPDQSTLMK